MLSAWEGEAPAEPGGLAGRAPRLGRSLAPPNRHPQPEWCMSEPSSAAARTSAKICEPSLDAAHARLLGAGNKDAAAEEARIIRKEIADQLRCEIIEDPHIRGMGWTEGRQDLGDAI